MTSINTNVPSMIAQRVLGIQNKSLVVNLERLSTGLRINRGKDDPAGLIASENLRAEKKAIDSAISNAERAEQVVNVAEGGLQEIANLLVELQSLVAASANEAGVSAEEKDANQLQIDSILQTIDRLANDTSFQGTKLLNGSFDYTTEGVVGTVLTDVGINSARLPDGGTLDVNVTVLQSAQTAQVFLSTGTAFTSPLGTSGSITLEVTGNDGVQQFTFASGTTQASIITAINSFRDAIGVSAGQAGGAANRIEFRSVGYGSAEFVRVKELSGPTADYIFASAASATALDDLRDIGRDAIVTINGQQATANGTEARVVTGGFDVSIDFDGASVLNTDSGSGTNTTDFSITGGGANFNLSPNVNLAGKVSLGIETVTTGNLGKAGTGFLSSLSAGGDNNVVNGSLTTAQIVIDEAIRQVSSLRGRLGAFQKNTVGATINSLSISLENTAAAESSIRDTDFAAETAALTRSQILG
ncbi:MAG: flagellin N-terminal helical domain-containing protein, partial [Planctomycetota bacterium]